MIQHLKLFRINRGKEALRNSKVVVAFKQGCQQHILAYDRKEKAGPQKIEETHSSGLKGLQRSN